MYISLLQKNVLLLKYNRYVTKTYKDTYSLNIQDTYSLDLLIWQLLASKFGDKPLSEVQEPPASLAFQNCHEDRKGTSHDVTIEQAQIQLNTLFILLNIIWCKKSLKQDGRLRTKRSSIRYAEMGPEQCKTT
jgi:hypothetical protein